METAISNPARDFAENLLSFTGTGQYHLHTLPNGMSLLLTDGCHYIRENASDGAYWLFDLILSWQMKLKNQRFQVWKLTVREDQSAVIVCEDGNKNFLASQDIPYTDFPIRKITIWLIDGVAILPSEY